MADYKELLRRAISALPENNGAARRAVYEKARSALVGQLRAIQPPLPARDITQHRLQLEDCIRQVEQEASEAVIMLGRDSVLAARTPATRAPVPLEPVAQPVETLGVAETAQPNPLVQPPSASADATSIEDIISQAAQSVGAPVRLVRDEPLAQISTIPSIVARAEATKTGPTSPLSSPARTSETLTTPSFETRRAAPALIMPIEPVRAGPPIEPGLLNASGVRQAATAPLAVIETPPVEKALSSVREVDVEPDPSEAQDVIERAIETLDREARGEPTAQLPESALSTFAAAAPAKDVDDANFADVPAPQRSGAGLTIFLVVFAVLLAGAGGAGFWAWREGYVDLDQMFGQAQVAVTETPTTTPVTPTLDPVPTTEPTVGNTAPTSATGQSDSELTGLEIDDRLEPTPEAVQPTGSETVLPDIGTGEVKTEERLPGSETSDVAATDPSASVDPAVLAGSQSLLLEASQDGTTGAVPFSGTVEWSEGVDELGLPTLTGTASIPARNLGVDITIRKNSDPSLPASHLMEVDFKVSDTFIGGTIANLPGILLKDEELVPGSALVGASARVVGNSFLFALSSKEADVTANTALLEDRRWMDLAVVYGTGRNAIITLEKDDAAEALFQKVFTAWAK